MAKVKNKYNPNEHLTGGDIILSSAKFVNNGRMFLWPN